MSYGITRDESEAQHGPLEEEWEQEAVPERARKPLLSVSLVWLGFPMILTSVVTGALIVTSLGFRTGVLAILIGNLLLFGYVGGLSVLGAKSGFNFALLSRTTFGSRGYLLASGLLATLVVGWFAVQTGLTAEALTSAFGWNAVLMSIVAGLLYTAVTLFGVRALAVLGALSAPLFIGFSTYALVLALRESSIGEIAAFSGGGIDPAAGSLGVAVALTVGLFIDSGTMTADFTRWAKSRRHAIIATFSAFPLANGIAMLFGGAVAAAAVESDLFALVADQGGLVAAIAVLFLFLNLGNVCAHCLYNASVNWANFLGRRFRQVAVVWGLVGTTIAASGVWSQFTNWLILLGVIVPPIGAIILAEHFVVRRGQPREHAFALDGLASYRLSAVAAWGLGAAAALAVHYLIPAASVVVVGFVAGAAAHVALSRLLSSERHEPAPQTARS